MSVGPKLMDGLRAIDAWQREGSPMADVRLAEMGYPWRMADDILERLDRKGLIESGTSTRGGWLTDNGRRVLNGLAPIRERDSIDDAIAKVLG